MSKKINLPAQGNRYTSAVIGRNAAWAVTQVTVSAMVLFVVYYFMMRAVGVDQIGLLSIVSTTVAVARLSELGLSGAVTRFLPDHLARGETADAAQVVVTAPAAVGLVAGLVAIVACPLLDGLIPFAMDGRLVPEARSIIPVTLLSLWINIVSGCVVTSLDGLNRADRRAQIAVLSQGVFAVMGVLMIGRLGIVAIPIAQAVQAAFVLLLASLTLLQELPEIRLARPSFSCFKRIWPYGAHIQLITLLVLLYDPVTRLLLNYFGSLSAVGYFDLANRLISQVRSLIVGANQVMIAHYASLNSTNPNMVACTVRANFQILLVISTIIFSMSSVSLFFIAKIWIGQDDTTFIQVCMILIVGYFANALSAGIYFMNMGVGAVRNNVASWIAMIAVNIIGGIVGGSLFGVIGVLLSVSAALLCGSIVTFAAYLRKSKVSARSLGSPIALKFFVVGGIVFMMPTSILAAGIHIENGVLTSLALIGLGGFIWLFFVMREASFAGQSPLLWAQKTIASFRL